MQPSMSLASGVPTDRGVPVPEDANLHDELPPSHVRRRVAGDVGRGTRDLGHGPFPVSAPPATEEPPSPSHFGGYFSFFFPLLSSFISCDGQRASFRPPYPSLWIYRTGHVVRVCTVWLHVCWCCLSL